jgi:hypothetical protein
MSFAMSSLLMHNEHVPAAAREAIRAAHHVSPALRLRMLESAARILHDEVGVDCFDALELLDLVPDRCTD